MPWGPVGPVGPGTGQGGGQGAQPQGRLSAPQRKRFMGLSSRGKPWEDAQKTDTGHFSFSQADWGERTPPGPFYAPPGAAATAGCCGGGFQVVQWSKQARRSGGG